MKRLIKKENNTKKCFNVKKKNRKLQAYSSRWSPLEIEKWEDRRENEFRDLADSKVSETFPNSNIRYYYNTVDFGLDGKLDIEDALNCVDNTFNSLEKSILKKLTDGKLDLWNPKKAPDFYGFDKTKEIYDYVSEDNGLKKDLDKYLNEDEIKSFDLEDFCYKVEDFFDELNGFFDEFCDEMKSEEADIFISLDDAYDNYLADRDDD
jgi:hypothetical protein